MNLTPDLETIVLLLVVGNLAMIPVLLLYLRGAGPVRSAKRLIAGQALQAAAWALMGLRGSVSDLLSVYAGNLALMLGYSLEIMAIASVGKKAGRFDRPIAIAALAGAAAFCAAWNHAGRVIASSAPSVAVFAIFAAAMLERSGRSPLRIGMGLAGAAFAAILAARAVAGLAIGPEFSFKTPAPLQYAAILPVFVFILVGDLGYILLLKEGGDAELRASEIKYRTLVERASEAIFIAQDGKLAFANRRLGRLLGAAPSELVGREIEPLIWPEDRRYVMEKYRAWIEDGDRDRSDVFRLARADGPLWMSLSAAAIEWKGRPAILGLLTDIGALKLAEERVVALLAEKEVLLREVHHRVKQNLAVAASLLSLGDRAGSADPESVLRDARNRLQAMVQLYDRLDAKGGSGEAQLRDYLPRLLGEIVSAFPSGSGVKLDVEIDDSSMDAGRAAKLGIILNEIVTNSLKFAFAGVRKPAIRLSVASKDGRATVVCGDNGRGLPPGMDEESAPGLGMRLVRMLAERLGGKVAIERSGGTAYRIELPLRPPPPAPSA